MKASFFEAQEFTRDRDALFGNDENFRFFQDALMNQPEAGVVIAGTHGARKVRWADPHRGKGKRGGIRVIYHYGPRTQQFLLLLGYDKNTPDLTASQKQGIAERIRAFEREMQTRGGHVP